MVITVEFIVPCRVELIGRGKARWIQFDDGDPLTGEAMPFVPKYVRWKDIPIEMFHIATGDGVFRNIAWAAVRIVEDN